MSTKITIRLSDEEHHRLARAASDHGLTVTTTCRLLLQRGLDRADFIGALERHEFFLHEILARSMQAGLIASGKFHDGQAALDKARLGVKKFVEKLDGGDDLQVAVEEN
ncbi:MAG: hypothetical protein HKL99_12905 [Burkholderiales bacterium]|nr:hypothetical protein [Burkholderiales bacterium]